MLLFDGLQRSRTSPVANRWQPHSFRHLQCGRALVKVATGERLTSLFSATQLSHTNHVSAVSQGEHTEATHVLLPQLEQAPEHGSSFRR